MRNEWYWTHANTHANTHTHIHTHIIDLTFIQSKHIGITVNNIFLQSPHSPFIVVVIIVYPLVNLPANNLLTNDFHGGMIYLNLRQWFIIIFTQKNGNFMGMPICVCLNMWNNPKHRHFNWKKTQWESIGIVFSNIFRQNPYSFTVIWVCGSPWPRLDGSPWPLSRQDAWATRAWWVIPRGSMDRSWPFVSRTNFGVDGRGKNLWESFGGNFGFDVCLLDQSSVFIRCFSEVERCESLLGTRPSFCRWLCPSCFWCSLSFQIAVFCTQGCISGDLIRHLDVREFLTFLLKCFDLQCTEPRFGFFR